MSRPRPVIDDTYLLVSGNVVIHPTATIAPDVLLQADPDCQLVVAAGACIGTGSVIHAHQGKLSIEAGAIVGNGVLIVGHGTIGAGACIGAMSTIIDSSIEANAFVPPDSLIGDRSRQVDLSTVNSAANPTTNPTVSSGQPAIDPTASTFVPPNSSAAKPPIDSTYTPPATTPAGSTYTPPSSPATTPIGSTYTPPRSPTVTPLGSTYTPPVTPPISHQPLPNNPFSDPSERNGAAPPAGINGAVPPVRSNSSPNSAAITPPDPPPHKTITQVYGQAYLQRIMGTMFPHRKLFEPPKQLPEDDPNSPAG
ncbi:hypothetical protein [Leptolyngbya ohadii]|uniref:hypothetical protein n=1 Tax=Leptolyngbya ohadii TaxID=1962290 RepID=UPI000B59A1A5|nr:hypothetical protein [Leptolyngbya ohadii]